MMHDDGTAVLPLKDPDGEHPVPTAWRETFREIVKAFVAGDYRLARGVARVASVDASRAEHMAAYVADYGETLTELADETWKSSIASWQESHWEVLVDLWTVESGCSDMVLHADVFEADGDFRIEIDLVYVP
jgi:hypothetical protein